MSAADTLAGYAGGDAVKTAADKVADADSGAINDAAGRLSGAAKNAGSYGHEVAGGVSQLDAAWEGDSADEFVAYMGKFGKAGDDIATSMSDAATALKGVAGAIDDAKTYISNRCDQALREIRTWLHDNPHATQAQIDAHTKGICSEVAGDINRYLAGTESTLSSALGTINGAKSPASKFSSLAQPNTQAFTPHPGQPIEWNPTPQQQTKPSAATGPNDNVTSPSDNSGSSGSSGGGSDYGGGSSYSGPSSGGPPAGPVPGNVQEWIKEAIAELRKRGINVSEADAGRIWQIIQHESGGNPHAINNWDSNAAKGTPSKGLMQTIDPTFQSYKLPGHDDIWNPVDNICAGVNYAISRYGSLANVPGIKATDSGGSYVGY